MTAARASAHRGCRASRAMESTLFVAVSCLLLHLGEQSTIRKAVSVLLCPLTLDLRVYVCGSCWRASNKNANAGVSASCQSGIY